VGATVFRHQLERALGDGAHLFGAGLLLQVDHGPHMQQADAGVGVPGAGGAVGLEQLGQAGGEVGQVLQRDGAIFDEADGLAYGLHRHDDVEPRLPYAPDPTLPSCIGDLDDGIGIAEAGHHGVEPAGVGPDGRSWMSRAVTMCGDGRSMDDRVV